MQTPKHCSLLRVCADTNVRRDCSLLTVCADTTVRSDCSVLRVCTDTTVRSSCSRLRVCAECRHDCPKRLPPASGAQMTRMSEVIVSLVTSDDFIVGAQGTSCARRMNMSTESWQYWLTVFVE